MNPPSHPDSAASSTSHRRSRSPTHHTLESVRNEACTLLGLDGGRKRRKRVRYSCTECHRRKHRCDRETPCGKCIDRGVAGSCVPFDAGEGDAVERVRQLEEVLSRLVSASASAHEDVPIRQGMPRSTAGPSFHTAAASLRRKSNPGITTAASLPFRASLGSETIEFASSTHLYPPSAHFTRLVREGSLSSSEIRQLASALPAHHRTAVLLEVFFRDINPLMFPFDETIFREALNTADVVWGDEVYDQDAPNQLSVLTLLFAVLALTLLSQPLSLGSEAEGAAQAARMAIHCRRGLMLAGVIQCHDAFIVLAGLLLARYLILQRQAKDSWLVLGGAIREAKLLGFHSLGAACSDGESNEVAMQRVIWSHLYFEDRFSSLIVGQAPLVHDEFCTTVPPLSLRVPEGHFDVHQIIRIRYDMTCIVSRILDLFFCNHVDMCYEAVLELDRQLQVFRDTLPAQYHPDTPSPPDRNVALHRFVLHISLSYLRISLNLPFLRRGPSHPSFSTARSAILDAALFDHRARLELKRTVPWPEGGARDAFVGGRFFYFHATSALGICLLTEPHLGRVREGLEVIDEFVEAGRRNQSEAGVDPNRCIRQELGIVGLIRARVARRVEGVSSLGVTGELDGEGVRRSTQPQLEDVAASSQPQSTIPEASATNAHRIDTQQQPDFADDTYDWWSWLVSSLTPGDLNAVADLDADDQRPA